MERDEVQKGGKSNYSISPRESVTFCRLGAGPFKAEAKKDLYDRSQGLVEISHCKSQF